MRAELARSALTHSLPPSLPPALGQSYIANWEYYVAANGGAALSALASGELWNTIVGRMLPLSVAIGAGTGAGAGALAGWSSLCVQVRVLEAAKL